MLDRADAPDQQSEELPQTSFVKRAADTPWGRTEGDRSGHIEEKRAADTTQVAVQISRRDLLRPAQRDRAREQCRHRSQQLAREWGDREVRFLGEKPTRGS